MLIFPLILVVILFFQNLFEEKRLKAFLFSLFWGMVSTIWATYLCGNCSEVTGNTFTSVSFKISLANSYHEQALSFDK